MLEGIRTPDPRLRRPLLYPAELRTHLSHLHYNRLHIFIRNLLYIMLSIIICKWKAGDGNRTHVSSLEGWCSTIELHPHTIGVTGFEPATSWSQTRRSSQAEPHPESIVFHYTFKTSYKVQESNVFESRSSRFRFASSR